jgi:hypothetical protein
MIGLRPKNTLDREHRPFQRQPQLPGRLGIGPAVPRNYATGPWEERWSETLAIEVNCANAASERIFGRWLHQPFIIRGLMMQAGAGTTSGLQWWIGVDHGAAAAVSSEDRMTRPFIDILREDSSNRQIQNSIGRHRIQVGTIITEVPTRLQLIATNTSGAAQLVQVLIDVTYLCRRENSGNPHSDCSGCSRAPSG